MRPYFLGNGHHVYDTGHYYTLELDIGFTKENQEAFFQAIDKCDDEKIKKYLEKETENTYNSQPTRAGFLVEFDINGKLDNESAIIKLAKKYDSLKPEDKLKAISILESLMLAHKLIVDGQYIGHKKIIVKDIGIALNISKKHKDKNSIFSFRRNLRGILDTHYSELDVYDLEESYKQGSGSGKELTTPKVKPDSSNVGPESGNDSDDWEDITPWLTVKEFDKYELKEEKKLAREEKKPVIAGLRMGRGGRNEFVKGPAKADKSDTGRTNDQEPNTSPAQTSASPAATKVNKAPHR